MTIEPMNGNRSLTAMPEPPTEPKESKKDKGKKKDRQSKALEPKRLYRISKEESSSKLSSKAYEKELVR